MSSPAAELRVPARVSFTVYGLPVPQGSKQAYVVKGRAVVTERGRAALAPWRGQIAAAAAELLESPIAGAVEVELTFTLPRPKSHFRSGAFAHELREDAPVYVSTRPDLDKLVRAVLDGLSATAIGDDGQVASLICAKVFGDRPGVSVEVRELVP